MANFIINGGKKLGGTIATNAAKNASVAILCASTMIKGKTVLKNVPVIEEVKRIIEILESIGIKIEWTKKHELLIDNSGKLDINKLDRKAYIKTRSGLLLMGALSSQFDEFFLPFPHPTGVSPCKSRFNSICGPCSGFY